MHFSPGKIQQRVRSAQRFSHLKCIEFITYSRPTAASTCLSLARCVLIDNVFSCTRDSRVFFVIARLLVASDPRESAAENKIAMEKFQDALTAWFAPVRFAPCEFSLTVHRLFHSRPRIRKITAVRRDTTTRISRVRSRSWTYDTFLSSRFSFPFPLCAYPGSRWCLTTVLQAGKAAAANAKPRTVTSETRETIKTS